MEARKTWLNFFLGGSLACGIGLASDAMAQERYHVYMPEQRQIDVRDPASLPHAIIPLTQDPRTVKRREFAERWSVSLNEAIRIALANAEVVRVLTGISAANSGRTIYDPAITNTGIDVQKSRFDPTLSVNNGWNRVETPTGIFDPLNPGRALIVGNRTDNYNLGLNINKNLLTGANIALDYSPTHSRFSPGGVPLNPQWRSATQLSITQPLMQGAGFAVNATPIIIARIDTERSYFQFKDTTQELVRGVVQGYWDLVAARTARWAREQQVQQGIQSNERAEARIKSGFGNQAEVAQTKLALENFRANLIAAEADVLNRETALRNLLGLPPEDGRELVPVSPPSTEKLEFNWDSLVTLAEERRPDIVELKLILQADQQQLVLTKNQARPRLDAIALYRWNGLEGEMPNNIETSTDAGEFHDWTLGINFSVPLGLRQGRAQVRRQELLIARDRANLNQGVHAAVHALASVVRQVDAAYAQYEAFKATRDAAEKNLEQQLADYRSGRAIFLNVLQAIADWGNAVSAQSLSLAQYNAALANLERESGTILETHGVRFLEERWCFAGPHPHLEGDEYYPAKNSPSENISRYQEGTEPAEKSFNLNYPSAMKPEADKNPDLPPNPAQDGLPKNPDPNSNDEKTGFIDEEWDEATQADHHNVEQAGQFEADEVSLEDELPPEPEE